MTYAPQLSLFAEIIAFAETITFAAITVACLRVRRKKDAPKLAEIPVDRPSRHESK